MASERPPIVVAGAGPTGLMCALALARQGVSVVVCEAEPSLTHDLRAGSFHPPTLEMMAPYGVTCNAIAPCAVDTEMALAFSPEQRESLLSGIPLGRLGTARSQPA